MASRHEEKYIIDYLQYVMLRQRAMELLTPDPHGQQGHYTITSLYYDDPLDNALYEKLDGLAEHRKFRVRTYDSSHRFIKLERKDKHGILTEKAAAPITRQQIGLLDGSNTDASVFTGQAYDLAAQIQAGGLMPAVTVRYERDAFFYAGTDLRLTFDTALEVLPPDPEALFSGSLPGIPVLGSNQVIMEIKYGDHVPSFVRKMTAVHSKQLSVSKYALCREKLR
jgi:hypothetical protein